MHNTVIIGAGQIASGFDNPEANCILTHAHGILKHPEFNLSGFYDIDYEKAVSAAEKWKTKAFQSLEEIESIDVIVVTTPDDYHLQCIKDALNHNPKLIILEKPIARKREEALAILDLTKGKPTVVNFTRRFVKEFQTLAEKIRNGDFGKFVTGSGLYGKGFVHNGSHMIDLLNLLVGDVVFKKTINEFVDFYKDDVTKTVELNFKDGQKFFMQGVDCRNVTVFELDLFFESKRIKIVASGRKIISFDIKNNNNGYKMLDYKGEIDTEIDFAMYNLYENVYDFLTKNKQLLSTVKTAYQEVLYD